MLGGIAFSVYEWLKCAFARHSFLIVEGSIDKMKNIYPLNSRFTLPFAFVLAVSLLAVSLMFMLPGGLIHAQTPAIEYPENGTGPAVTFTAVDPEGASIVWSLDDNDNAAPNNEIFSIENGVLRFKSSPDYEIPLGGDGGGSNTYVVKVQASDGGGDATTSSETVTINVTNVNEPGTVILSTLQPQAGVQITAMLTDPDTLDVMDQGAVTWQWSRGNSPIPGADTGTVQNNVPTSTYTPTDADVASVLSAKAMYDDVEGDDKTAEEDSANAVREGPSSNVTPTFPTLAGRTDTNQEREVSENTPAGTNIGAPVVASDTDILTYSLEGTHADSFDINRATGQLITEAALDAEAADNPTNDEFSVTVRATDPFGAPATALVTIKVADVNEAPMFTGGPASIDSAEGGTELQVDGGAAVAYTVNDPDAEDAQDGDLKWSLSGADASKFDPSGDQNTMRGVVFKEPPDFEAPGDSDGDNIYEVTLVVTDSKDNTAEQAVMVKVTNMEEMGTISLSTLQPRVGFSVTATLTDPDNVNADSVEWQWYRGATITINENNFAAFNPGTGLPPDECDDDTTTPNDGCAIKDATSAVYVPLDDDVADSLTAVATYTDGNGDDKDYAAKAERNPLANTINDAPVFPDMDEEMEGRQTAQERNIAENSPAVTSGAPTPIGDAVTAMDEDLNLTYALGGPDAASFGITRNTGQLQVKAALDTETKDTYTVTVTATDSLGASSTITVTIKVDDVDEMPELVGEAPEEYAENGTGAVATFRATDPEGDSISWSLGGADEEDFSIENGVLRFKEPPDFEMSADADTDNTYAVTIQASDGGTANTTTKDVTIAVTNVEEPGTVMLSTLQPQVGVQITATLTDLDKITDQNEDTITWQWYRGNSAITGATDGAENPSSMYMPAVGDIGSALRAVAMYNDNEGEDKRAEGVSYRSTRREPAANTGPVFPDQDLATDDVQTAQRRNVAENTPAGTNLGAPVVANDRGDVLTYALAGGDAAQFSINRVTGQLSTKEALDYEDQNNLDHTYTVTVTATDPSGISGVTGMSVVTIMVTDVNEAPSVEGVASIDRPENDTALQDAGSAVEYTAMDEDADDNANDLKWSLSGVDASMFDIPADTDNTRTLVFKADPNYESPGDSDSNNVYEVTLVVTDSRGNTDEQAVTVKVSNLEEDGTIELSTLQPRVSFPVTATLADPDNIVASSVSWQWYRGNVTADIIPEECAQTTDNNCAIKGAVSDTYTPVADDVGDTLSAVATYIDGSPNSPDVRDGKDVVVHAAAQQVLADTRNKAPVFPDADTETEGVQPDRKLTISEAVTSSTAITSADDSDQLADNITAEDSIINVDSGVATDEVLTYTLGGPDVDSFSLDRSTAQLSTKVGLDKETKDTYTVTVTATDPSGLSATITVTITVTNVDEAPEIMLGGLVISGMRTVDYTENDTDAVATYMVAGPDAASARWSLDGPDAGAFTITIRGGVLTFRNSPDYDMPADADTDNTYMVTVKASDGTYMDTREVTVTVVADAAEVPTTISGRSDVRYAENGTDAVATYTLAGTNAASATLSLSGADAGDFTISDGMLAFSNSPDYEMPADADMDNTYMVTLNADGDTYDVTIMVVDVPEVPTIAGDATINYTENSTDDVATFISMDPEGATVSWTLEGTDAGVFDISNGGVLTFKSSPDYEMPADANTDNDYMVTVNASDGTDMDSLPVTVTVTDVGEALTSISGPSNTDYAENGTDDVATFISMDPDGTAISWTLEGTDADVFDISNGGVLTFKSPPDYETKTNYTVTVEATAGTDMATPHQVTVTVTDVNEALTAISGPSDVDYAENDTDDVATFISMDPEGAAISWTLEGTDADVFDISNGGVLTFKSSSRLRDAGRRRRQTYMVTVKATDGTDMATPHQVTVTVTDVNEALTAISGPSNVDYAENGTDDVATFISMDPEGATISWTLEGTDADVFDISSGGVLTFRSSPDYEMAADADTDNIYMDHRECLRRHVLWPPDPIRP